MFRLVERKFQRTGRILHIHLPGDKLIRTTPEHPFYVQDRGWTAAGELLVGSIVRTDAGWVEITDLLDTGEYEPVYNLQVAEWRTYFVGEGDWGWSLWAQGEKGTFMSNKRTGPFSTLSQRRPIHWYPNPAARVATRTPRTI